MINTIEPKTCLCTSLAAFIFLSVTFLFFTVSIEAKETAKESIDEPVQTDLTRRASLQQYPVNSTLIGAKFARNVHNLSHSDVRFGHRF